ncbi:hypothetical protein [Desulfocicer vacuolatum]|uniref:hypothetical protein n=1 Tax=Desulfocicer vacuolatum TaxID=2298 RepID=UPI001BAF9545|nr:hypothetical protein [Desulfocicer vacuolatum]
MKYSANLSSISIFVVGRTVSPCRLYTQLSVFAFRGGVRLSLLTLSRLFSLAKALVDNINNKSLTPSAH